MLQVISWEHEGCIIPRKTCGKLAKTDLQNFGKICGLQASFALLGEMDCRMHAGNQYLILNLLFMSLQDWIPSRKDLTADVLSCVIADQAICIEVLFPSSPPPLRD